MLENIELFQGHIPVCVMLFIQFTIRLALNFSYCLEVEGINSKFWSRQLKISSHIIG